MWFQHKPVPTSRYRQNQNPLLLLWILQQKDKLLIISADS